VAALEFQLLVPAVITQIILGIMLVEAEQVLAMLVVGVLVQDKRLLARLAATVLLVILLGQVHIMVEVVVAQLKVAEAVRVV
jgi:hypothetical protein